MAKPLTTSLLFVTALQAEALPLIQYYHLKSLDQAAFPLYANDNVMLVISGMGQLAAAAATAYAFSRLAGEPVVSINVGVAGANQAVGSLVYASTYERWRDDGSKRRDFFGKESIYYPHLPCKTKLAPLRVATVEQPSNQYLPGHCYDMEAYGYADAARHFVSFEKIHCLKVISDNPDSPLSTDNVGQDEVLPNKKITALIASRIDGIEEFAQHLCRACETPAGDQSNNEADVRFQSLPRAMADYLSNLETGRDRKRRFSATQWRQITRLATRYQALGCQLPEAPLNSANANKVASTDVIKLLEKNLDGQLPSYGANKNHP